MNPSEHAAITGWGGALPPAVRSNDDHSTGSESSDEWIDRDRSVDRRRGRLRAPPRRVAHPMRTAHLLRAVALLSVALPLQPLPAQAAPAPGTTASIVTRADLALAYLAFDRAFTDHPPTADRLGRVSQAFDQATLAFFGGRNADAVRAIHTVTQAVLAPTEPAGVSRFAIRATVEPHVFRRGSLVTPTLRVVPLYAITDSTRGQQPTTFRVTIVSDAGRSLATELVAVEAGALPGRTIERSLPAGVIDASKGRYRVFVSVDADGPTTPVATSPTGIAASEWFVTDDDLDAKREEFAKRAGPLDTIVPPALTDAIATLKARIRLLTTRPSPLNTTVWRANPLALVQQLERELQLMMVGVDPYVNASGSLWQVIRTPPRSIPVRTWVPVPVARARAAAPLLIAIHGVGGDENMFPDALGAGQLQALADTHGFVVASPNGDLFSSAEDFDRLVEMVAAQLPIDRSRIWIIGHSRGAGQALALAAARRSAIAGVVCIAGFGRVSPDRPVASTLVILGELDPLAQPARILPLVQEARAAGAPVESEVLPLYGHTTVVNAALPTAVRWLLPRTLPPASPDRR